MTSPINQVCTGWLTCPMGSERKGTTGQRWRAAALDQDGENIGAGVLNQQEHHSSKSAKNIAKAHGRQTIPVGVGITTLGVVLFLSLVGLSSPQRAQAQTTINICDRTPQIEAKILRMLGKTEADCGSITAAELETIGRIVGRSTMFINHDHTLTTLKAGDFDGLTNLGYLNLRKNNLSSLPAGTFDGLTWLDWLILFDNSLSSLPAGIFDKLTRLDTLYLGRNSLSSLPAGIFDKLTRLEYLDLSNNNLSTLPAGIFDNLTLLHRVDLRGTSLPLTYFDEPTQLRWLGYSGPLSSGVFDKFTRLERLFMDNSSLSSLPAGVFNKLIRLEYLDLSNNNLSSLPAGVFNKLTRLKWLNLSNNNLTCLPSIPSSVTELSVDQGLPACTEVTVTESDGTTQVRERTGAANTDTYTVALATEPTSTVTIAVTSGDTGAATVSPPTLTFSTSNWNTAQRVTVTGVDDAVAQNSDRSVTISHSATSGDAAYNGITIADVTALVADGCLVSVDQGRLDVRRWRYGPHRRLVSVDQGLPACSVIVTESDGTTQVNERTGAANTDTYTVVLDTEPTANVTIAVASGDTGAATVSPAMLTFSISDWNTAQTVTVSGVDDAVAQNSDRSVTISHSATSSDTAYNGITIADVTALVSDGCLVSDANWNTVSSYYVHNVERAPNYGANWYRVLIAYAQERTDKTLPRWGSTTSKPTTPYTAAEAEESEKIWGDWTPVRETLECLERVYTPVPQLSAQQSQAPAPEISLRAGAAVSEGDDAVFTVEANPAPQSDLTVEFSVSQDGEWLSTPGAGARTLTLTAGATSADLTVATENDSVDESDGSISVSIDSGTDYTVAAPPNDMASVTVEDNDSAGVSIIESDDSTSVTEAPGAGHTDSYVVKLAALPTGSVTVAVASGAPGAATVSPATLTFSTSDWNRGQTVTVTGVDDFVAQGSDRSVTISHSATSSDANYDGIAIADVSVTVVDDDTPGVRISESSGATAVSEAAGAGHSDSYTVALDTRPSSSVTVEVVSGDSGAATVSPATLTFSTGDWNTVQAVTVSGVDDNVDQSGNRRVRISHSAASSDVQYRGIRIPDVTATVVDDDTAGVSISQSNGATSVSEAAGAGRTDGYTMVLNSEPSSSVTVEVVSGDSGAATVSPATLTFTPSNWNTVQSVTVSGVDDHVDQRGSRSVTIAHSARSTDTAYDGISILPVSATVTDDDTAGVSVIESDGFTVVSEAAGAGQTDTYTVVLTSEPTDVVRVSINSGAPGAALVNGAGTTAGAASLLSFTPSTWSSPQTVTVSGVDDNVDQSGNRSVSISHGASSQDPAYEGISISSVSAMVMDDGDGAGVRIIQSGGATVVTEAAGAGQRDSYTVALTSEPTHGVTVTVVSGTPGAALVNGPGATAGATATLTFTPSTWSTPQTVTVTGVDDSVNQGGNRSSGISHRASSQDPAYEGISIPWVRATVVDDDTAGVRIIQSDGATAVTEAAGAGQTDSYTVALTSEPTHGVRVTVVSGTPGAALVNGAGTTAGATATLTFTPSTWSTPQTVTVTGVDDKVNQVVNRSSRISHSASSADPIYDGISIPWVSTVVVDDENAVPATSVVDVTSGSGTTIGEGDSATFTFTANPAPGAGSTMTVSFTMTGAPFRKRTSGAGHNEGSASATMGGAHSIIIDDSGMAQFTVSTLDNSLSEGKVKITATVDPGVGYSPHPRHGAASVTVVDDDPGLMVSADSLSIEAGGSASYTMALATEPMGEVTVSISGGEGSGVTVAPTHLTFSEGNWERPQSVGIRAAETSPALAAPVTLSHTASGGNYGGLTADVVVNVAADAVAKEAKKAWHLRLGRTISHQVVDALQDRLAARPATGLQVTVAGEAITDAPPLVENQGILSKALGFETVSPEALVEGSSFSFAPAGEASRPQVALWGQGAFSSFRGEQEDISLDGEVTTLLLGADWTGRRWQAGAAVSQSWGHGSYDGDNDADGEISSTVTGLFPYGRYALTPRLGLWATAGYGWGQLFLKPDGMEEEYKPSTTLAMGALGMDGLLRDGGSEGITLRGTADVLTVTTTSEEVDGLESSEGSLSRLRLGVEAVRPFPLANGSSLLPSMELGIRQDSGDAETGFGMDLGAGILWQAPGHGISGELKGHTLLTHAEEELQDQGLSLSFSWEPNPSNRGPSLSVGHTIGAAPSEGMDTLLHPTTMGGLDAEPTTGQWFEAELAYGFPAYNDRITISPAVAMALSPSSRTYGLLWSVAPYSEQPHAHPWQLSIEAEQELSSPSTPIDHSFKLTFSSLL